jgi:NitT/TauT family transport system substrate-binding protein
MKTNSNKYFFLIMFAAAFTGFLYARASSDRNLELTIYSIKGSSGVGLLRLFEEPPELNGFDVKLRFLSQQDQMAARFLSGEAKVGILPPNMAAKIASSGKDIRAAAVIGTGMLSLLSSDPGVNYIEDLKGKTVEVAGQGATPDYVFRRILLNRNLDPGKDLTLSYSLAHPEIAQSLIAGRVSTALLPEPFATMAQMGKPDLKVIGNIQDEWINAGGKGNYPMTLFMVDGEFASDNPLAIEKILNELKKSIEWVAANPSGAGALAEKHELGFRAGVVAAAIPNSGYVFIPAIEARPSLESLFKVFLENSPASIGGVLPDDIFYYK